MNVIGVLTTVLLVVCCHHAVTGQTLADVMAALTEIKNNQNDMKTKQDNMEAKLDNVESVVDLFAREHLESAIDDVQFIPSSTCATDQPATSLPSLADVSGVPDGVSGEAKCGLYCRDLAECKGFNYKKTQAQCDLYTASPSAFNATTGCQYYMAVSALRDRERIPVQQNYDGSTFFQKTWAEYKEGFGNLGGNYWLGNDKLHTLTATGLYKMRFDLQFVKDGKWYYAEYSTFAVADEANQYRLSFTGFSGNATDGLYANGARFSTKDRDNDDFPTVFLASVGVCGDGGGFWYGSSCGLAFINSPRVGGYGCGFTWRNDPVMGTSMNDWKLGISRMTLIRK